MAGTNCSDVPMVANSKCRVGEMCEQQQKQSSSCTGVVGCEFLSLSTETPACCGEEAGINPPSASQRDGTLISTTAQSRMKRAAILCQRRNMLLYMIREGSTLSQYFVTGCLKPIDLRRRYLCARTSAARTKGFCDLAFRKLRGGTASAKHISRNIPPRMKASCVAQSSYEPPDLRSAGFEECV